MKSNLNFAPLFITGYLKSTVPLRTSFATRYLLETTTRILTRDSRHKQLPFFQAIQLIIHIARCDWPEKYPDFYNNILTLIASPSPSTAVIGLLFLQTASEELGTPRDDVLSSRKTALKQRLLQFVPQTLRVLTGTIRLLSRFIFYNLEKLTNTHYYALQDCLKQFGKNKAIPLLALPLHLRQILLL